MVLFYFYFIFNFIFSLFYLVMENHVIIAYDYVI